MAQRGSERENMQLFAVALQPLRARGSRGQETVHPTGGLEGPVSMPSASSRILGPALLHLILLLRVDGAFQWDICHV
jgi:hypothetical protein